MIQKVIILSLLLVTFTGCKDDKKEVDVEQEIAALKSFSEKEQFLETIFTTDQAIRNGESSEVLLKYGEHSKEVKSFRHRMDSVDQLNLKRIDLYLKTFEYPDKSVFSESASIAPWIVIHHAAKVRTRNKYFPILKKAYENKDLTPNQFELYLGRTYQMKNKKYPTTEGPYRSEDKINRLIKELDLE